MASSKSVVTMNISLPEPLKKWVDNKVASGVYGTASEFVRETLREKFQREQELKDAKSALAEKLLAGLEGKKIAYTSDYIAEKKQALLRRSAKAGKQK